jgi:hypothetical protein
MVNAHRRAQRPTAIQPLAAIVGLDDIAHLVAIVPAHDDSLCAHHHCFVDLAPSAGHRSNTAQHRVGGFVFVPHFVHHVTGFQ